MLKPINNHILIEPLEHESFMAHSKDTFEEIGMVVAMPDGTYPDSLRIGTRIYFDSWLAKKYPKENGTGFYWLVNFNDVVATSIPE